jgi:hypothetical protein
METVSLQSSSLKSNWSITIGSKITNRRFLHLLEMIRRESIWNGYDASNKNLNEKEIEIDVRNLQGTPLIFSKWACGIP